MCVIKTCILCWDTAEDTSLISAFLFLYFFLTWSVVCFIFFLSNLLHHCAFVEMWELAAISHLDPVGVYLLTFRQCCSDESCSEPAAASWGLATETSTTRGTQTTTLYIFTFIDEQKSFCHIGQASPAQSLFPHSLLFALLFIKASFQTLSPAFKFTLPLSAYCAVSWEGWGAPNRCVTALCQIKVIMRLNEGEVGEQQEMKIGKYVKTCYGWHEITVVWANSL